MKQKLEKKLGVNMEILNKLPISEIFEGIQGEGRYIGTPALFIRVSGCNLNCSWCDTKYHTNGKAIPIKQIIKTINKSKLKTIIWSGGEPLLYIKTINYIISKTNKQHHLETNGELLKQPIDLSKFEYISISPKNINTAKFIYNKYKNKKNIDIKVVTNLKNIGTNMIKYTTILMPLSTFNKKKDIEITRKVWNYCIKHNIKFSPRIHTYIWGKKRGI